MAVCSREVDGVLVHSLVMLPTIFDCCVPREDVLASSIGDYAAELRTVIRDGSTADEAGAFFENTYPTQGLKRLLEAVGRRLSGDKGGEGSALRLDSTFGGGKTHGMIALVHMARYPQVIPSQFLDSRYRPTRVAKVAAFDGEMANVSAGVELEAGLRAKTPWGYLAYRLGGTAAYRSIQANDEDCSAPGSEDWLRIIGDEPALILVDEIGEWLRKLKSRDDARQLAPFLKALIAAVDMRPDAALVISLAIGKGGKSTDAFTQENEAAASALSEAEGVAARKMVVLNPTTEDETASVLARRLFSSVNHETAEETLSAYAKVWERERAHLADGAFGPNRIEALRRSYPFHPDLISTLNAKTATYQNFQRVRGMLRILTPVIRRLWEGKPNDATAIHTHHVDMGLSEIRSEFTTKLGLQSYDSAISYDIANADVLQPARAQKLDAIAFAQTSPFATYVARTIFVNSLAVNDELRGLTSEELRASMLSPGFPGGTNDGGAAFVEEARKRFIEVSGYLDDRTSISLRFAAEANLTKLIEQIRSTLDRSRIREELKSEIGALFKPHSKAPQSFDYVPFPTSPADIPDDANDGKPFLALLSYEAVTIEGELENVPPLLSRLAEYKGSDGTSFRLNRNNLVFVVADARQVSEMIDAMGRKLALDDINDRQAMSLSEHQGKRLRELREKATQGLAIAVQQCYRHILYPAVTPIDSSGLTHLAMQRDATAADPGSGQQAILRTLVDYGKVVLRGSALPNPVPTFNRTQLATRGTMTTSELREEFRRDRHLPMLFGDDPFIALVRAGVDAAILVYTKGELLYAKGEPPVSIEISEAAAVVTVAYAREHEIYPRKGFPQTDVVPSKDGSGENHQTRASSSEQSNKFPSTVTSNMPLFDVKRKISERISETGLFAEAINRIFEKSSAEDTNAKTISITATNLTDIRGLISGSSSILDAETKVNLDIFHSAHDSSEMHLEFNGTPQEAKYLVDTLSQHLKAAADVDLTCKVLMTFESVILPAIIQRIGDSLRKVVVGEVEVSL